MQTSFVPWVRRGAAGMLAAVFSIGAAAQASAPGHGREMAAELKKRFSAADVDHDGLLTRDEAKSGMPFVYRNFDAIDTARAGRVSMTDIAAFFRNRSAARKAGA